MPAGSISSPRTTRRALLAAMRLPAGTEREAADSLVAFADERDRRPLPASRLSGWAGEPVVLAIPLEQGLYRRPLELVLALEDGGSQAVHVSMSEGRIIPATAWDGRPYQLWQVELLPMPIGRHVLTRQDAPDAACRVTVAPRRCWTPDVLADGRRLFGLSAQLYSVRRPGDQGVGDFTTLAELAEAAAPLGASTVMINPLHALFAGDRSRASPYSPSDRRFLDPLYLDLGRSLTGMPSGDDCRLRSRFGTANGRFLERQFAESGASTALDRFIEGAARRCGTSPCSRPSPKPIRVKAGTIGRVVCPISAAQPLRPSRPRMRSASASANICNICARDSLPMLRLARQKR